MLILAFFPSLNATLCRAAATCTAPYMAQAQQTRHIDSGCVRKYLPASLFIFLRFLKVSVALLRLADVDICLASVFKSRLLTA